MTALYYAEKNGNDILLRWLKEADSPLVENQKMVFVVMSGELEILGH